MISYSCFGEKFSGTRLLGGKGLGLMRITSLGRFREEQNDSGFKVNFPCFITKIVSQGSLTKATDI